MNYAFFLAHVIFFLYFCAKFIEKHKTMESMEHIMARKLLQMKAFRVQTNNPFTWANGWQAPIYFDDRRILSYTAARNFVRLELAHKVAMHFPDRDVIAGVAVNAITHAVLVAEQLGMPFVYVYPKPKDHGLENQIEGELAPRQGVIVIENQVSAGIHAMKVAEALRNNGCRVQGIVTIFNYQLPSGMKRFQNADIPLVSLTDFNTVLEEAEKLEMWNEEQLFTLREWHKNPNKWRIEN